MADYPIYDYPTNAETDPNVLYQSLGSFWTQIFQEQGTIKGYTLGLAEELIQRYYSLVETINSYAVKDVDIFHKEKWTPLRILKSSFGGAPFVFEPSNAVFGAQPGLDHYYSATVFQFGFVKRPTAEVYTYYVGEKFKSFGVIADKVFNPNTVLIRGTDVILDNGVLYFNRNLFEDQTIARMNVVGDLGEPVTYTDATGVVREEQMMILWLYNAQIDTKQLYTNFGCIFNLIRDNDAAYKEILKNLFQLYVDGPTVRNVMAVCSAFLGVPTIIEASEKIEKIFEDGLSKFVVTDRNVYKFPLYCNFLSNIRIGVVLHAGDMLVDSIQYFDNVETPGNYEGGGWWTTGSAIKSKLALSQHLFLGSYKQQLVFPNSLDLVTVDAYGRISFPVDGNAADVALFHSQINIPANATLIKSVLGLNEVSDSKVLNPVDFILSNFLRNNSALLGFKFYTQDLQSKFLSLLPYLRTQLPPYIYIIFSLDLLVQNEEYDNLNDATVLELGPAGDKTTYTMNADGSNPDDVQSPRRPGNIDEIGEEGYKDLKRRLFSLSPTVPAQPKEMVCSKAAVLVGSPEITAAANDERLMQFTDGKPLKQAAIGSTTAVFGNLLLLDFE